jgi:glycerophosphoryl diester phosphodiesterase
MFKFITLLFIITNTNAQTCIAHRANGGPGPENSQEALEYAIDQGFDGVEFDIQFSKDGVPFLYHDKKIGNNLVGRQCPKGEKIKKLNYAQFSKQCSLTNGSPLMSFEDALKTLSTYEGHIFIDLKQKASAQFLELFDHSTLLNNSKVRFISFKRKALRPLKKRWPQIESTLLSLYFPRGLFYEGVGFNKRLNLFTGLFRLLGKNLSIWTLNQESEIKKAFEKKADFIITDDYDLCFRLLPR